MSVMNSKVSDMSFAASLEREKKETDISWCTRSIFLF